MSLFWIRKLASILALSMFILLGGCISILDAELNNRGGYIDQKLDNYWIEADTKQMRVLRAYVLIGSVARMSREGFYKSERENLVQAVNSAVNVANDAFICAYTPPGQCVYFDERMAEMEIAILRLTIAVLTKHENESLFSTISKELSDAFPLLKAADSLSKLVDALENGVNLTAHGLKIVKSIITLGSSAYISGRRLGALYRDSIELHMVTVLASLDYMCKSTQGTSEFSDPERILVNKSFYSNNAEYKEQRYNPCKTREKGWKLWQNGAGDLSKWRDWLGSAEVSSYLTVMIPDRNAFSQASDLIWRACEHITHDAELLSKCIGRRPKNKECGCMEPISKDTKQDDCRILSYSRLDKEQRTKTRERWADFGGRNKDTLIDSCPLIGFSTTWDRRNYSSPGADAILTKLSVRHTSYRSDY